MWRLIVLAALISTPAFAQGATTFGFVPSTTTMVFTPPHPQLTLNHDGKTAILNFEGDEVKYSGDLPVDDAAKVFFNAVLRQMRDCR